MAPIAPSSVVCQRRIPSPIAYAVSPFTRQQALSAGLTPKALRGVRFQHVFHGVYAEAALALTPLIQCHAALLVAPADAIVEGVTGLQAAGLDIGASVPVRLASTAQVRIEGINVRQVTQLPPHRRRSPPWRTAGQVACPILGWPMLWRQVTGWCITAGSNPPISSPTPSRSVAAARGSPDKRLIWSVRISGHCASHGYACCSSSPAFPSQRRTYGSAPTMSGLRSATWSTRPGRSSSSTTAFSTSTTGRSGSATSYGWASSLTLGGW